MRRICVTGATGNVGKAVLKHLAYLNNAFEIYAGVRHIEKAASVVEEMPDVTLVHFDIEDQRTFQSSFKDMDVLFLLRPPQISQVDRFFKPLLEQAKNSGISNIVFLSVQGAEKSTFIPHRQIELLIREYGFQYIFVRPGYFMQNLSTTLLSEIKNKQRITLPAGSAVFNWIDVDNIGEVIAIFLTSFDTYKNKSYDITGDENKSFVEVAQLFTHILRTKISYRSVNPLRFYFIKRKEGASHGFALVMTILHFLPRFQRPPEISNTVYQITKKQPTRLEAFILREKECFK